MLILGGGTVEDSILKKKKLNLEYAVFVWFLDFVLTWVLVGLMFWTVHVNKTVEFVFWVW